MTEGQYHWYQYWFLYEIAPPPPPPNIYLLTIAIQHYSIIERYKF